MKRYELRVIYKRCNYMWNKKRARFKAGACYTK